VSSEKRPEIVKHVACGGIRYPQREISWIYAILLTEKKSMTPRQEYSVWPPKIVSPGDLRKTSTLAIC
jgi:hypothetical protein